ncbi:MAG: hypothetical protein KW806_02190 [Candidatus Yanofskybacteria bacterium]|nr:hypothetical protein [Candidatus Yanofskybacteria bacterium]
MNQWRYTVLSVVLAMLLGVELDFFVKRGNSALIDLMPQMPFTLGISVLITIVLLISCLTAFGMALASIMHVKAFRFKTNYWTIKIAGAIAVIILVIGSAACSEQQVNGKVMDAVVKDAAGEGTVILQKLSHDSGNNIWSYLICRPDGKVALYNVSVFGAEVSVFNDPIIFEKGSRQLANTPVEEVVCKKATAIAQVTPALAAP